MVMMSYLILFCSHGHPGINLTILHVSCSSNLAHQEHQAEALSPSAGIALGFLMT